MEAQVNLIHYLLQLYPLQPICSSKCLCCFIKNKPVPFVTHEYWIQYLVVSRLSCARSSYEQDYAQVSYSYEINHAEVLNTQSLQN